MKESYHQFNETLMAGLNPTPFPPAETDSVSSGTENGTGTLQVQVTLAKGAVPVEGVRVIIQNETTVLGDFLTDKSGKTPLLSLPAPSRDFSQVPNPNIRPYSLYNIRVTYPGYYVEEAVQVPVFDGINSIQPVALVPLPETVPPGTEILIDESNQGPV